MICSVKSCFIFLIKFCFCAFCFVSCSLSILHWNPAEIPKSWMTKGLFSVPCPLPAEAETWGKWEIERKNENKILSRMNLGVFRQSSAQSQFTLDHCPYLGGNLNEKNQKRVYFYNPLNKGFLLCKTADLFLPRELTHKRRPPTVRVLGRVYLPENVSPWKSTFLILYLLEIISKVSTKVAVSMAYLQEREWEENDSLPNPQLPDRKHSLYECLLAVLRACRDGWDGTAPCRGRRCSGGTPARGSASRRLCST